MVVVLYLQNGNKGINERSELPPPIFSDGGLFLFSRISFAKSIPGYGGRSPHFFRKFTSIAVLQMILPGDPAPTEVPH